MQTGIIALVSLAAVLVGGFIGSGIAERDKVEELAAWQEKFVSETPAVNDFLSMRPAVSTLPAQSLSAEERADILYVREEEKLARDVYQTLYETWQLPIFSNIAQSEQTHTEAVRTLLTKYSVADPVTNDAVGSFTNTDLAALYTSLVAEGTVSLEAALTVGAIIEDLDIADLEERIAHTDNQDIQLVFENLMRGSRNHLRSFVMQLERNGGTYTPEYISQEEYEIIIGSDRETGEGGMMQGGAQGSGQGMRGGRGWGNR